jgi:hypothetical protein
LGIRGVERDRITRRVRQVVSNCSLTVLALRISLWRSTRAILKIVRGKKKEKKLWLRDSS